jgi:hypothetical protein
MKKVKMLLSAAAVIAIVSSALAFKVHDANVYCPDPSNENFCTRQVNFQTTANDLGSTTDPCGNGGTFETSPVNSSCSQTGTVYNKDQF